ncbi:PREDICTED: CWF19-like protein 2 isoform X2 [Tarenaya hassleriana]|uniref:CWF19-like protein 2 isoform X2 n=1 Tax=Tarenaya hassleriana TaxID=28532 RepID=UPI00053C490E|nr:PREDICTED: CWF19-like protein 2 isoform X2 [Tarenaya hassleriana]
MFHRAKKESFFNSVRLKTLGAVFLSIALPVVPADLLSPATVSSLRRCLVRNSKLRKDSTFTINMLSGIKIIPREEVLDENSHKDKGESSSGRDKRKNHRDRDGGRCRKAEVAVDNTQEVEIVRKKIGLDWMLPSTRNTDSKPNLIEEESPAKEVNKVNPKELNPYLKNNGTGYPEEGDEKITIGDRLPSTSLVGDGGASWRLKALKRAKEQAAREGKRIEEVVEERWGSLGKLAVSVSSQTAAPSRAHLHAIKNRRKGHNEEADMEKQEERVSEKSSGRAYLRDVSLRHPEMRAPKADSSLSWGKRKGQAQINEDAGLISEAASRLNKFANDGNFMKEMMSKQRAETTASTGTEQKTVSSEFNKPDEGTSSSGKEAMSANQMAAKALQLRMKGKHEEAQKLMEEADRLKAKQAIGDDSSKERGSRTAARYAVQDVNARKRGEEDNTDRHLARSIMQNKRYSVSGQADDEYDYGEAPSKKSRKRGSSSHDHSNISERDNRVKRILTQQERCLFCFENQNRPKHLVVSIANFTYLMLPQRQSVVPGHCCVLPMQHEAAMRMVDDDVWEEIRNFMFAKQGKEVVFLETVMGLSQQRRHCMIECIPLPQDIAKEAPLYFKKAIDEAEDEWSQHNAKKLIDTSVKGLRNSIPKDFPYFHVEFGLNRGFVHVIDDEKQFNGNLGMNVIRGMLQLPEEDMYRRRRYETEESQKQAMVSFSREWEPFDWTKQLG